MCEHKNLRTVGDRLFCKDCKKELPLEFLYKGEEVITEPVQEEQEARQNAPASEEQSNPAPKKETAKKGRKTAKKEV